MEMYQVNDIDHFYGEKQVLSVEDAFSISPASITGLIGPNGSGKSTLLKLLGFIEKPTYGSILYKGKKGGAFSKEVRFAVTLLPQEPYLLRRSVFENVAYGLRVRNETRGLRKRVLQALELVGLEGKSFARRRWYALSGGEAQRVALAARLILRPEVLLLDEPTARVDADSARLIRKASLKAREEWGTTIVVATHDWQWLYETCDSVIHLLHGRLFSSGLACAVSGPWKIGPDGLLHKELEDGQALVVPAPEEGKKVAIIDPAGLGVSLPGKDTLLKWKDSTLSAIVSRLFLERGGDTVQVAFRVAELGISMRMERDKVESLKLYPGKEINVSYDPAEIEWF